MSHHEGTKAVEGIASQFKETYKGFIAALDDQQQLMNYYTSPQGNREYLELGDAIESLHGAQRKLFLRLLGLYERYGDWIDYRKVAESAQVGRWNVLRYLTHKPKRKRSSSRGSWRIRMLVAEEHRSEADENGIIRRRLYLRPISLFGTLGKINYLFRRLIYQAVNYERALGTIRHESLSTIARQPWIVPWGALLECEDAKERILNIFRHVDIPPEIAAEADIFLRSIKLRPKARRDFKRFTGKKAWNPDVILRMSEHMQENIRDYLTLQTGASSMHFFHLCRGEGEGVTKRVRRRPSVGRAETKASPSHTGKWGEMFEGVAHSLAKDVDDRLFDVQLLVVGAKARELGPDKRGDGASLYDEFLRQFLERQDEKSVRWRQRTLEEKETFLRQFRPYDDQIQEKNRLEQEAAQLLLKCGEDPERYGLKIS